MEAYYEDVHYFYNNILYPFSCHMQESIERRLMVDAHWHYYIEMLYNVEGNAKVVLGGDSYPFCKGDMVIMNSREVHSIFSENIDTVRYIVVKFDPQVLYTTSRTIFESKYVLPFVMAKSSHQKVFKIEEIDATPLPELMMSILQEFNGKAYGFELAIRTHICRIFLWVLRNWWNKGLNYDTGLSMKESDMLRLQKVFDYLDENYMNEVTAEKVAKMFGMSYSYFSRYFKAMIGKTFTDYVNYVRITEAEKLLMTTDKNITEVAMDTGFSSSSYFIQQFKHFKNVSPKQYQKKINKG